MENRPPVQTIVQYINHDMVRLLQALHEFVIAGSSLMLVSGPHGSGKSHLLEQFVQGASPRYRICRTSATVNPDGTVLLARIARCFEFQFAETHGETPVTQLRDHLAHVGRAQIPVIVIDDAERLSDESLLWLSQLVSSQPADSCPRIVLFGEQVVYQRLADAGFAAERLELLPLDVYSIGDYLRYLLKHSGHSGHFPFSPRQLRRIEKESGGWPGRIPSVAQEILSVEGAAGLRPWITTAMVMVLLLLVVAALYFVAANHEPPANTQVTQQQLPSTTLLAAEPATEATPVPEGREALEQDEAPATPAAASTDAAQDAMLSPAAEEARPARQLELSRTNEALEGATVNSGPLKGVAWIKQQPRGNFTLQVVVASDPGAVINLGLGARGAAEPMAVAGFTQDGRQFHLLLYGSYATRGVAEGAAARVEALFRMRPWIRSFATLPALSEVAMQAAPTAPSSVTPPSVVAEGAAWLWSRNPTGYTIQLLSDGHRSTLDNFIEHYHPAGPLAVVRVDRGGKAWYLLLTGEYKSAVEAAAAIAALPDEIRGGSPWSRQFSSVQDQMVTANH